VSPEFANGRIRSIKPVLAGFIALLPLLADPALGQDAVADDGIEKLRASVTGSGPYETARLNERSGIRNGPDYDGATIHYPIDAEGPLPSMVLVPGYLSPQSAMARWGPFLASHGIVTMIIGTNRRSEMPEERAAALLDAVRTLEAETLREESPLLDRLDVDRIGVGGWSMGGGGAQLAAVEDPDLDVVLALCPWKPGRSFDHPVPVMILGAERDRLASVELHAFAHYRNTSEDTPRLYFEVEDAGHGLAMSPRNAGGDVGRTALIWLRCFLEDRDEYRVLLERPPASAGRYLLSVPEPTPAPDPETAENGPTGGPSGA